MMADSSGTDARTIRTGFTAPATVLAAQLLLITGLAATAGLDDTGLGPAGWAVGLACGGVMSLALARGVYYWSADRLGPADWVTLTRAALVVGIAALVADSFAESVPVGLLVTLASIALVLDAVDGRIARRTGTASALGERMDGEVDAFLILVLSVYVSRFAGAWVLAIGAARYAFLVAGWPLSWMRAQLPARFWRKTVAATQGVVLVVVAARILPAGVNDALLIFALAMLTESFGRDVWWLWRRRGGVLVAAVTDADSVVIDPPSEPDQPETSAPAPEPSRRRRNVRRGTSVALTVASVVLVWVALVAPDQPHDLTPTGFLRLPLEFLVVIALALVLPRTPRRIVAVIAGLSLTLVVVLKVIDYEVFTLYNRPYDPLGDTSQLGNGIETLRSLVGGAETKLIEVGAVVGTVVLGVLFT